MRGKVQANLTIWLLIIGVAFVTVMAAVAYLTRDDMEIERIMRMQAIADIDE